MRVAAEGGVALFGGTFDPPHLGHIAVAQEAVLTCGLERVFFIPCRQSPHKQDSAGASGAERAAMLQLATRQLPWAVVSTEELEREGASFSYLTAQRFRERLPEPCPLYWILGADQWEALERWAGTEVLAGLLTFIVVPRDGHPAHPDPRFRSVFLEGVHPASATAIRRALAAREEPPPHLDPAVLAYIRQHGLYGVPAGA